MNRLDVSFEASPWEAFLMTKGMGETVSAVTLLSLLEGEDEQQLEDALQDLETAAQKQYQNLFDDDVVDITADMEVLTQLCRQNGLLEEDLIL